MCIFFVVWAAHHPEEMSLSNPQLNDKITIRVFSQCIHASDMPNPSIKNLWIALLYVSIVTYPSI